MANTVDLNEITEYFDKPQELEEKLAVLAKLIHDSKSMTVFTGAGISTSAQIPDFRGPNGVWTCQAKGVSCPEGVSLTQALPTTCHKFLNNLVAEGKIKYVVSQNIDGLHRRSGIPREKLSELHGNCFLEVCWKCNADYERGFEVSAHSGDNSKCAECKARVPHFCHCTKRKCENCKGKLKDSVIHFGENLPQEALQKAYENAEKSDLCVVFGSSLRVSPACDIPKLTKKKGGKLVIINLQTTPLDSRSDIRIYAKTDEVCSRLEQLLHQMQEPSTMHFRPTAPPAEMEDSPDKIIVGNKHRITRAADESENCHEWTMFVDDRTKVNAVRQVTYTLHPTFSPNTVTVTQAPFTLSRIGWGTFVVGVDVILQTTKGPKTIHYDHNLSFAKDETSTPYHVQLAN